MLLRQRCGVGLVRQDRATSEPRNIAARYALFFQMRISGDAQKKFYLVSAHRTFNRI
jgi:hypothetical protein